MKKLISGVRVAVYFFLNVFKTSYTFTIYLEEKKIMWINKFFYYGFGPKIFISMYVI